MNTRGTQSENPSAERQTSEKPAKLQKPYRKATMQKLTPEQAKLTLLGYASMGYEGAKDLLELLFPDSLPKDKNPNG